VQEINDCLKPRKSAGQDGITNEYIMFGGPHLVTYLCLLFTTMLRHFFVPSSFQFGIILGLPLPKDKHSDLSNLDMYRGITLTPAISRLFESVMLAKYTYMYIVIVFSTVSRKIAAVHMGCLILRNRFVFITNELAKYIVHS